MTNAEKFKEVFGFTECTQTFCKDCPFKPESEGKECSIEQFWQAEYKEQGKEHE